MEKNMYICVTEVDSVTKIPGTIEPQRNGPSTPDVKGLVIEWTNESNYPIPMDFDGKYLTPPKYFGTCDDDADVTLAGVLQILTKEEYLQCKHDEFYARQPFPSWVWNSDTLTWSPPMPYPTPDSKMKYWVWNHDLSTWESPIPLPTTPSNFFWSEEKGWALSKYTNL